MSQLTSAEAQVLALMAAGLTNRQIASALGKTESTVKNQINAIYRKGPVVNRNEARAYARAGVSPEGDMPYGSASYQSARP